MLIKSKKTLIPFFMAGYPSMVASERFICTALAEGLNTIEIGIPFSDPLADGAAIQRAASESLANGTTISQIFALVIRIKKKFPQAKIVLFTYLNPVLKFGLEKFVKEAATTGVAATLTVDLPPEEAADYLRLHSAYGLRTVFLASPTTSTDRARIIADASSAFVYYVSRIGVTGAQGSLSYTLNEEIQALQKITEKPIAIGFGISQPDHVAEVLSIADAAVVGSHFINIIEECAEDSQAIACIRSFIKNSLSKIELGTQR